MAATQTIKKLIHAHKSRVINNHKLIIKSNGDRWYYYYDTPIIKHHVSDNTFEIDNGGWDTMTTNQNIFEYCKQLCVPDLPFIQYKAKNEVEKQNIIMRLPKGNKIKIQFKHCPECKYFENCYITNGEYHEPHFLSEECI